MKRVGIYDLGTNTTRLFIAEVEGRSDLRNPDLQQSPVRTLERHTTITGLGKGVGAAQKLSAEAIQRTLEALTQYKKVADQYELDALDVIATSAVRDAENSGDFCNAVEALLGQSPRVITGEEEGTLCFLGATSDVEWNSPTLLVDIGGGSTELVFGSPGQAPEFAISLQQGAVRLTEQFLHHDPPQAEELSQAVTIMRDELEEVARAHPEIKNASHVVGVAGTVTEAAAIEIGMAEYDPDVIHHFVLTRAAAEDVFRTLATESLADRVKNPGANPARADVIVGGLIILVSVLRVFEFGELVVSESDLLAGAALSLASVIQDA